MQRSMAAEAEAEREAKAKVEIISQLYCSQQMCMYECGMYACACIHVCVYLRVCACVVGGSRRREACSQEVKGGS